MKRTEIFAQAAKKLRADFSELGVIDHNALRGGEAENLVRRFLNDHLPKRFSAGSGLIVDQKDGVSHQADVVVYDALNCPIYRASENASIFPNDNVAALVEVKSTLNKAELTDAWGKIKVAKALYKTPDMSADLINIHTLGVVFGFRCSTSLETIMKNYEKLARSESTFGRHTDIVVILDEGLVMLAGSFQGRDGWVPAIIEGPTPPNSEGAHIAVLAGRFGESTLDAFLRILLGHLTMFRHRVDHPGFDWGAIADGDMMLTYLTSITLETEPAARKQKLKQYRDQVKKQFELTDKLRKEA